MDQSGPDRKVTSNGEIPIRDLINHIKLIVVYLRSKWLIIALIAIVFGIAGLGLSLTSKNKYTALCTFVLEESGKGGGLGQYAGLASMAGIDIGGGGGLFQGENIIELYKSRLMIEKTLLSEVEIDAKKQLLIDRYINFNNLRDTWKKGNLDKITFTGDPAKFNRAQDSIISSFVALFDKKLLTVTKPDKKLSIINVQMVCADEVFAKEFTTKLVQNVNEFYVQTKTKKTLRSVLVLQRQADSVKSILNASIGGVADAIDATPNANPAMIRLRVPSQRRQIDVQANSTIYAEIVKNLEMSKVSLRQETPLIQVIDTPIYPLPVEHLGKVKSTVIGLILGFLVCVACLVVFRSYQIIMNK